VPVRCCLLSCDLSRANLIDHESQDLMLGVGDADYDSPIFLGVDSSERDSAFAVDQAGNVGRDFG